MNEVSLRPLGPDDVEFLRAMFLETVGWREDQPRLSMEEAMSDPDLAKYVDGWGRPGDSGVVAVAEADQYRYVGAAWYRLFDVADHGYGFVASDVPELGIATVAEYRGFGLGRTLMQGLIQLALAQGRRALSLSVEEDNLRATRLYESLGFERLELVGNAWTMLLTLRPTS